VTGLNNFVGNTENRSIYGAYENTGRHNPESNLRPETQRYIDNNIVPIVKTNPEMLRGMKSYLNSQGIFEPGAIPYITQRLQ
jgi:hypothetical protein